MRREVLINAIMSIQRDLISSGVFLMFDKIIKSPTGSEASWFSLEIFRKYALLVDKYGEAEQKVAEILGISDLFQAQHWSTLIDDASMRDFFQLHTKLSFLVDELPRLAHLLQQDKADSLKKDPSISSNDLDKKESITFILPEDNLTHSSPARLVSALEASSNLYEVLAELENLNTNDLILLSLDSGSDKSFDLLGIAKVMEQLRLLIIDIWDRRVFYRHKPISQSLELIANSLPILQKIDQLKKDETIEPEMAEILKRKTILGVTQFLESGVIIPEIELEATHSPRRLMQPEIKLLAAPIHPENEVTSDFREDSSNPEQLTDDELTQLENLLAKAKRQQSSRNPKSSKSSINKKNKGS